VGFNNLAILYWKVGRIEEAIAAYDRLASPLIEAQLSEYPLVISTSQLCRGALG
jgi:hypothetical protein